MLLVDVRYVILNFALFCMVYFQAQDEIMAGIEVVAGIHGPQRVKSL